MLLEDRIQHLIRQIEQQERCWDQVSAHPSYAQFAAREPVLRQSIARIRHICACFRQAVAHNDPRIPHYLDQLEESMFYLAREMDQLYAALGFATPPARVLH